MSVDSFWMSETEVTCADYREDSELSKLSAMSAIDEPVELSPVLGSVLVSATGLAYSTEGAYDPSLGSLTLLWRKSLRSKQLPLTSDTEKALSLSGYNKFSVEMTDDGRNWLRSKTSGLRFDLGGIAKGYAADVMHDVLRDAGYESCAIIAGGDVRVGAPPEGKSGWEIGLRTMRRDVDDLTITLVNAAVSTSGGLYQTVEIGGVSYSHILDPKTGLGLTRPIAASVIAPTTTLSEALATAACVAVPVRAADEIENWGGTAVRVVTGEQGETKVVSSRRLGMNVSGSLDR